MLKRLPIILLLMLLTFPFRGIACDFPVKISGDSAVCDSFRFATYYVQTLGNHGDYQWKVKGGTIISANGRPYVNVRWDTLGRGGKIWVSVTDTSDCESRDSLNIFVDPGPEDAHWFVRNRPGRETEFWAADSSQNQYEWTFGDGRTEVAGHRVKHVYRQEGQYTVRLKIRGPSGCWTIRESNILVNSPAFIAEEPGNPMGVHIYPNPFSQSLRLSYTLTNASEVRLRIFDLTGKEMLHLPLGGNPAGTYSYELDPDRYNLQPGMYILLLQAGNMEFTQRLVRLP